MARVLSEIDNGDDRLLTFVVDAGGGLRLGPRRMEHVTLAAGGRVRAAGEIYLDARESRWCVPEVTNQSTGYCPDLDSWPAVAAALDRVGIERPDDWTAAFVFRRCTTCGEINVVKDDTYLCWICGADLPRTWNVSTPGTR